MNIWRNGFGSAKAKEPSAVQRRVFAVLYPKRPDSQVTPLGVPRKRRSR